ncbi:hypothetical protein KVR01_002427 [Diaporthe batatas]|uniref:uncharacterized protein n=1 Tax=Diaporthe batatas TaxID=748121 RepID=UPI001D054ADE|nr:uncharacterized protein KVR01_002427 [Diaporthe batatas]KAG8166738.1 hypothetical protein KVR01_002427 [Diaporthe batatas]
MASLAAAEPRPSCRLELMTAYGPVYREVLGTAPRDCEPTEVPVIDLAGIYGDLESRKALAAVVGEAAEKTGFFYIKNAGIPEGVINAAYGQAQKLFAEPEEVKRAVSTAHSRWFNGWTEKHGSHLSPSETRDFREGFGWRYDPKYDPDPKDPDAVPEDIKAWIRGEDFVWEGTSHLPGFKRDMLAYWQECLKLARRMIRIFALALDLPEGYFDGINEGAADAPVDVGLGAHTDLQSFTFLWQDSVEGLQVLTKEGQWIKVPPIPNTFVVNIGDFLARLSNDRFTSTVHRVYNRAPVDRYSMPFFFGEHHSSKCGVLPTCTSESNPPRYEPITCGEVMVSVEVREGE